MARQAQGEGQAPRKWRGKWRASVLAGYDANGKQIRKYCYGKTQQECLEKWNELKQRKRDNTLPQSSSLTLKQYFDHWFKVKAAEIEARTIEEYSYTLRHILPRLGRIKVDKITPLQIQQMQLDVAEKVSARAAYHARGLVHNALDDALKLGLIARNPAAAVKPVKYKKKEFAIWSAEEVLRFLKFAEASPYYAVYYTGLTTGMRPGELIALHWADIEGNKLHVKHNVSVVKNKAILGPPKTKRGNRVLSLSEDTLRVLEQHRENLVLEDIESPLVFPSKTGTFLQHGNLLRTLKLYCDKAEIKKIRLHDLRHTYASMRIAGGTDIVRLSRNLGHANASFTLDVYAHLFSKHQIEEAPSLMELVGLANAA